MKKLQKWLCMCILVFTFTWCSSPDNLVNEENEWNNIPTVASGDVDKPDIPLVNRIDKSTNILKNNISCNNYTLDKGSEISDLHFSKDGKDFAFIEKNARKNTHILVKNWFKYFNMTGFLNIIWFSNWKLWLVHDKKILFAGKSTNKFRTIQNPRVNYNWLLTAQVWDWNLSYYIDWKIHNYENLVWDSQSITFNKWDIYYHFISNNKHSIVKNWKIIVQVKEENKRILEYTVSSQGEVAYVRDDPKIYQRYRVIKWDSEVWVYDEFISDLRFSSNWNDVYFSKWIWDISIYVNWKQVTDVMKWAQFYKINDNEDKINILNKKTFKEWKRTVVYDSTWMPWLMCWVECMKGEKAVYVLNNKESKLYNQIKYLWFSNDNKYFVLAKDFDWKYFVIQDGIEGNKYDYISDFWFHGHWFSDSNELVYLATKKSWGTVVVKWANEIGRELKVKSLLHKYVDNNGDLYYLAALKNDMVIFVKNWEIILKIDTSDHSKKEYNKWRLFHFENSKNINFSLNNSLFMCQSSPESIINKKEFTNTYNSLLDATK